MKRKLLIAAVSSALLLIVGGCSSENASPPSAPSTSHVNPNVYSDALVAWVSATDNDFIDLNGIVGSLQGDPSYVPLGSCPNLTSDMTDISKAGPPPTDPFDPSFASQVAAAITAGNELAASACVAQQDGGQVDPATVSAVSTALLPLSDETTNIDNYASTGQMP